MPSSPGLGAAIAVVGAAMAALGPPPRSLRTVGDLETWVRAWIATLGPLDPDVAIDVDAGADTLLSRLQLDEDDLDRLAGLWSGSSLGTDPSSGEVVARRLKVIEDPQARGVAARFATDPHLAPRSVWVRRRKRSRALRWRWPIDIAALSAAGGEEIESDLSSLVASYRYLEPLLAPARQDRSVAADMLLLRGTLAEALRATEPAKRPPRAGLMLIQSEEPVAAAEAIHAVELLGRRFPGSAVAWAPVPRERFQPWFESMVRELSHNEPLDVAMFKAGEIGHPGTPPILIAPPGFMRGSRLSHTIEDLERRLRRRGARAEPMMLPPEGRAAEVLGTAGDLTAGDVGERLRNIPRDVGFASERGLATAAVEIDAAAPTDSAHRFLQARLTTDDAATIELRTWTVGPINVVAVRIGPQEAGWLTAKNAPAFPVEAVVGDEEEAEAEVLCYVSGVLDEPLRRKMTVRRVGASSICRFPIAVPETADILTARIVVMHGGRIIQSGRLVGPVRRTLDEDAAPVSFTLDAAIRTNLGGFRDRQRFDACLLIEPGSTEIREPGATKGFKAPPILSRLLDHYDTKLTDVAKNPDNYASTDSEASIALLRELAQVGSEVRDDLAAAGFSGDVLAGKRLQVVATTSSVRVPLELFYDGRAPVPGAGLCDNWKSGLLAGSCAATCPADQGGSARICPRRFWGLSRVIERHVESTSNPAWSGDFAIRAEPDARTELRLFRSSAVAGSSRVTKHLPSGLSDLRTQLEEHDGIATHHRLAGNWLDWQTAIQQESPSLLLLLPHTTMQGIQPQLEIGGDLKLLANIEVEDIGSAESRPVVVLLGCETDTNPSEFLDIVGRCRRRGAVIVVAFGATIAVKHAVPAAQKLLEKLAAAARATPSETLGDAMLATRRALVVDGWIAALGLAAYGDADWKLAV